MTAPYPMDYIYRALGQATADLYAEVQFTHALALVIDHQRQGIEALAASTPVPAPTQNVITAYMQLSDTLITVNMFQEHLSALELNSYKDVDFMKADRWFLNSPPRTSPLMP